MIYYQVEIESKKENMTEKESGNEEKSGGKKESLFAWVANVFKGLKESIVAPPAEQGGHTEFSSLDEALRDLSEKNRRELNMKGVHIKSGQIVTNEIRREIENGKLIVADGLIKPKEFQNFDRGR